MIHTAFTQLIKWNTWTKLELIEVTQRNDESSSFFLVQPLHDIMQTLQYSSLHKQIDHYHLHQIGKNEGIFIILITNAVACDKWENLILPSQLQNML